MAARLCARHGTPHAAGTRIWGAPESTPNPTIQVNFYSNGWGGGGVGPLAELSDWRSMRLPAVTRKLTAMRGTAGAVALSTLACSSRRDDRYPLLKPLETMRVPRVSHVSHAEAPPGGCGVYNIFV